MIYLLLLLTFYSVKADTADLNCLGEILNTQELTKAFALPNCASEDLVQAEKKALKKLAKKPNAKISRPICTECKKDFYSKLGESASKKSTDDLKKKAYFEIMYKELQRSMSSTLVDIVSMRTLNDTGSKYQESKKNCNVSDFEKRIDKCGEDQKRLFKEKGFSLKTANEIANLTSDKSSNKFNGYFARETNQNSCSITEKEILALRTNNFEETLEPSFIQYVSTLTSTSSAELYEALRNYKTRGQSPGMDELIKSHPLLSSLASDPKQFVDLFRSVPSPQNTENLKHVLYSKDKGDQLDKNLAKRCKDTFDGFINAVCSPAYDNADIDLGDISSYEMLADGKYEDNGELATSIDGNLNVFNFCEETNNSSLKSSENVRSISGWMSEEDRTHPLNEYLTSKYRKDFQSTRNKLCEYQKTSPTGCFDNTEECKLYKNLIAGKALKVIDPQINDLLRTFIATDKINNEIKEELAKQNIINVDEKGKIVDTPVEATKRPSITNSQVNSQVSAAPAVKAPGMAQAITQRDDPTNYGYSEPQDESTQTRTKSAQDAANAQGLNANVLAGMNDLSRINSEIARRLLKSNPSSNITKEDIKKVASEVLNEQKPVDSTTAPSPSLVNSIADKFQEEVASKSIGSSTQFKQGTAKITDQKEDKFQKQMNAALEGMGSKEKHESILRAAESMSINNSEVKTRSTASTEEKREKFDIKLNTENNDLPLSEILKAKFSSDVQHPILEAIDNKKSFILTINGIVLFLEPNPNKTDYVFKSYASSDKEKVEKVVKELRIFLNSRHALKEASNDKTLHIHTNYNI